MRIKKGENLNCDFCGLDIYKRKSAIRPHNYCSKKCCGEGIRKRVFIICKSCGREHQRPYSQVKWRGSGFCSRKCKGEWMSEAQKGEKNPQWQGGVSSINHRLRASKKWKIWRAEVFKRDDYTCCDCGGRSAKGRHIILHPHHKLLFSEYPNSRFLIANGKTLCIDCHKTKHYAN